MKKIIFINAFNIKSGGGEQILINVLDEFRDSSYKVFVLISNFIEDDLTSEFKNFKFLKLPFYLENNFLRYFLLTIIIPIYVKTTKATKVLSLGNYPLRTKVKQITYIHWPFLVYKSTDWGKINIIDRLKKKFKVLVLKNLLKTFETDFIVQTQVMKDRLEKTIPEKKCFVIFPNISFSNSSSLRATSNDNRGRIILFYPSLFYPHKNHMQIIEVANSLRKKELKFKFIVTLQNCSFKKTFQEKIKHHKLENFIDDIGLINRDEIRNKFYEANFLFMPTLLETFGLPYIEAMSLSKPIITSNKDFSRNLCEDAALYFDPYNAEDICKNIFLAIKNENEMIAKSTQRYQVIQKELENKEKLKSIIDKI